MVVICYDQFYHFTAHSAYPFALSCRHCSVDIICASEAKIGNFYDTLDGDLRSDCTI